MTSPEVQKADQKLAQLKYFASSLRGIISNRIQIYFDHDLTAKKDTTVVWILKIKFSHPMKELINQNKSPDKKSYPKCTFNADKTEVEIINNQKHKGIHLFYITSPLDDNIKALKVTIISANFRENKESIKDIKVTISNDVII